MDLRLPAVHVPLKMLPGVAALRQISGHDEQAIIDTDSITAINLLDRLLVDTHLGGIKPGQAVNLPTAERDFLLAQVYIDNFGDRIASNHDCVHCGARYEISFSLSELVTRVDSERLKKIKELVEFSESKIAAGADVAIPHFLLKNGVALRVPTGREELQLLKTDPDQAEAVLLACCINTEASADHDSGKAITASQPEILQAMEALAPLLELDMDSRCPECEGEQQVHFAIQGYLLNTLLVCKSRLLQEIHALASTYHWSLDDILALPRHQRLALFEHIEDS